MVAIDRADECTVDRVTADPALASEVYSLVTDAEDDGPPLRFLAGETARLLSRFDGADSLRKADVLETLDAHDRTEAYRIYEAYVEGTAPPFEPDDLRAFVLDRVRELRVELRESRR